MLKRARKRRSRFLTMRRETPIRGRQRNAFLNQEREARVKARIGDEILVKSDGEGGEPHKVLDIDCEGKFVLDDGRTVGEEDVTFWNG